MIHKSRKRLKICLISIDYPPDVVGGTGIYTKNIAEYLNSKNHKVVVVTASKISLSKNKIPGSNIKFVLSRNKNIFGFWSFCFNYLKNNSENFDIVHGSDIFHFPVIFFHKKFKIITTIHNSYLQRFFKYNLFRKLYYPFLIVIEQILLINSDKIISVSDSCNIFLKKYFFIKEKINLIPNGVDIELFKKNKSSFLQKKFHIDKNSKIVLFVGRLVENKNPLYLCNLANRYFPKDWKLIIVGDGPQREKIKKYINKKQIFLINKINHEDMSKIYNSSDLFILPSKSEGLSFTLLEALACQLPVIISPESNYRDLIENGVNGFLLRPNNEYKKWIQKINKSISMKSDYGINSRNKLINMNLTIKDFQRRHLELYIET